MARLSILLCTAICLLVLSFSSALPNSALSDKLHAQRSKLGSHHSKTHHKNCLDANDCKKKTHEPVSAVEADSDETDQPVVTSTYCLKHPANCKRKPHTASPITKEHCLKFPSDCKRKRFLPTASPKPVAALQISNQGFFSCLEHPINCLSTAGGKILSFGSSELHNLESDLASSWSDLKNGLSDIDAKVNQDFDNFQKFVSSELQGKIISGLEDLVGTVLKKVGSFVVGKINTFQTQAQAEISKAQSQILAKLKSVVSGIASDAKSIFSSSSTAADLEQEATSSDAKGQASMVERTAAEALETDAATELEMVVEDTLSASNILKIIGKSIDLGVVFAAVDISLLPLGFPIVVFEDRASLAEGDTSQFESSFVTYYQSAIFNTFKNVVGDFLSYFVSIISASISTTVMAAIDVSTLGLGALPAAAISFVLDMVVSIIINLILSTILSLSFKPFYNMFWNVSGGLESDMSALAGVLAPIARQIASKV